MTSGTTSGTSGSIRQADELSITTAPCAPIFGDHSLDTLPPADIRQMSTSEKSRLLQRPALERPVAVGDLDALAFARGDRDHLVGGKAPLGQDIEHLAANVAGGAYDGDLEAHAEVSRLRKAAGPGPPPAAF